MRPKTQEPDSARRARYRRQLAHLCDLRLPDGRRAGDAEGCPWPAQLRRVEAGETVIVRGWEVGIAQYDQTRYLMDAEGRLSVAGSIEQ